MAKGYKAMVYFPSYRFGTLVRISLLDWAEKVSLAPLDLMSFGVYDFFSFFIHEKKIIKILSADVFFISRYILYS